MKIRVIRKFRYQVSSTEVAEVEPGEYVVGKDITAEVAEKIRKFGKCQIINEKKAPENKARKGSKTKVAGTTRNRRRARAKPDA